MMLAESAKRPASISPSAVSIGSVIREFAGGSLRTSRAGEPVEYEDNDCPEHNQNREKENSPNHQR